jgi:hypothetical protein
LERKFNIGDVVYSRKEGTDHQYEVVGVYPLETEEKHFKLKRIVSFDLFENPPRFYSTDYFRPVFWILEREVIIEKCLEQKY